MTSRSGKRGLTVGMSFVLLLGAASLLLQAWTPVAYAADNSGSDSPGEDGPGVLGPLNPPDGHGHRLDQYEITGDEGGAFDFGRKVMLFFTQGLFALTRWIVGLASWLIDWVLHFEIAGILLDPVRRLVAVLEQHLIVGIGLGVALLTVAATVCGWWILRGRHTKGLSEFVVTLLILGIATVWVANPATAVFGSNGLLTQVRDVSLEVASLVTTNGEDPTGGEDRVSTQTRALLVEVFVRAPHQLINYGTVLEAPGQDHRCLDTYEDILADAPDYEDGEPWERMRSCDEALGEFNEHPTWDRLGASLLAMIAAVFVTILAIVITLTLLVAQLWLVFETIRLLFALVIGLVPGPARRQLWKALGGLAAALSAVVATVVFLALYVVLVRGLLAATGDQTLFVRFLLLDVAIFAGLAWYRQLVAAARRASVRMTSYLGTGSAYRAQGVGTPPSARAAIARSGDQVRQVAGAPGRSVRAIRHSATGVQRWAHDEHDLGGRLGRWTQAAGMSGLVHGALTGAASTLGRPAPNGRGDPEDSTGGEARSGSGGSGGRTGSARTGSGEQSDGGDVPAGQTGRPGRRARIDRHRRRTPHQLVWQTATVTRQAARAGAVLSTGGASGAAVAARDAAVRARRVARTRQIADRNRERLRDRHSGTSSGGPVISGRTNTGRRDQPPPRT